MVPRPYAPPVGVMPYRFPAASNVTPAPVPEPSFVPVKSCSTFCVHTPLSWLTRYTTPQPSSAQIPPRPPITALPYRLPCVSSVTPPYGCPPSLPPVKL